MRVLMENMHALNVNTHQDEQLINSAPLKDREPRSMIPTRQYSSQSYRSNPSQNQIAETTEVFQRQIQIFYTKNSL